jgi:hypothetical protein
MYELNKRAGRPTERYRGSIKESFAQVRHYIGRLTHHIRAPKELVEDARSLQRILDSYEVQTVPFAKSVLRPPAKRSRNLDNILGRILREDDPGFEHYQSALGSLDAKFKLLEQIQKQYEDKNFELEVHAEIQVLNYFHNDPDLKFANSDRYIACSKPACYCCHLYFRNHPVRPVEPSTHRKIWLKWGPPASTCNPEGQSGKQQREILNKMIEAIRNDVLQDLDDRERSQRWHADSHTGITESAAVDGFQSNDDASSNGFRTEEIGEFQRPVIKNTLA